MSREYPAEVEVEIAKHVPGLAIGVERSAGLRMVLERICALEAALQEILAIEDCGDYYHDFCQCLNGDPKYRPVAAKTIARRALEGK